jgi:hypothetical protein
MRLAYIIHAYKDAQQLNRLINSLDYNADFFLHVNSKADIVPFYDLLTSKRNVFFTKKRFFVNWGSFSQVIAQRELLSNVFNSGNYYERVVCLSGLDYPIWPMERIINEFEMNKSKQFIMGFNLSKMGNKKQLKKITVYHFFRDLKVKNITIKQFFTGTSRLIMKILPIRKRRQVVINGVLKDVYMGSDFWSLTYDCAKFVYETICKENSLMKFFKSSYVPSEMCVQTIVFNSKFSKDTVPFYNDYYNGLNNLTPLHYIEYGKSIKIFDETDYNTLIKSGKMFFRKAATGKSDKLISMIDKYRSDQYNS